jgi:hypothetical protein
MTVEGFEPSQRIGKRAFDDMRAGGASVWSTDCPLAALQFEQHAGTRPLHPLSILARAYRGDPFPAPSAGNGGVDPFPAPNAGSRGGDPLPAPHPAPEAAP